MSTFNRNTLALALAAALLPVSAFAFDFTTDTTVPGTDTTEELIAAQTGAAVTMTENIEIHTIVGDNIVGRNVGFNVKLGLTGATFTAADCALPGGPGLIKALPANSALINNTNPEGWTISFTGCSPDRKLAQYGFSTVVGGDEVGPGTIATIAGLDLDGVSTSIGATVSLNVVLTDPGTGNTIGNGPGKFLDLTDVIVKRSDGLAFTCTKASPADKIDVAGDGTFGAKTAFVASPWPIGGTTLLPLHDTIYLGDITVAATAGFNLDVSPTGNSLFSEVTFVDAAPFADLFLATDNTCGTSIQSYTFGTGTTANTATLDELFDVLNTGGATYGIGGGAASLCATVDGVTEINAQTLAVVNGIDQTAEPDACAVAGLEFNGSVIKVFQFNPGDATTNKSFLRVSNWGNSGGKVTIQAWDDSGTPAPGGNVTFNMTAGQSMQVNSEKLEAGGLSNNSTTAVPLTGALGDGAGKWRLVVTGEFDGMVVQSLFRHTATDIVTNLTDADNRLEQVNDGK